MDNKIYREIDLVKLFYHILQRWRFIIVCLIIGVLVLGGYSALQNMPADTATDGVEEILNLKGSLSESRQAYVETTAEMICEYQSLIEAQQDYNDNAVFMQIDPYNVTIGKKRYYIDNFQMTEWNNGLTALVQAYVAALRCSDAEDEMCRKLVELYGVEKNDYYYYRELVKLEAETDGNGILTVVVYGNSDDVIEDIFSIADSIISNNMESIKETFGDHTVTVIGQELYTTFNSTIRDDQLKYKQTVLDYENKIESYRSSITDDKEKAYLEYLLQQETENYFKTSGIDSPAAGLPSDAGITVKQAGMISGKYVVLGAILGIAVGIILIIIKYICLSVLRSCEELENTIKIPVLARLDAGSKFEIRHSTKFDRWIRDRKLCRRSKLDYSESINLAAAKVLIEADKDKLKKICIASDIACDEKLIKDIINKLDGKIEVIEAKNFLAKADALRILSEVDGVVLFEQTEVSRFQTIIDELKICSKYKISIIGAVVLE